MPLDIARRGTLDYKDPPLRVIVNTDDAYQAGYHKGNVGGLDAIDTDLATGNIKNGITIFGKVGSADVFDISDATAVEAEVLSPETFYAVSGGRRTGTMPTVALVSGSSAYPAGYHVGDGGGLPAIDADLVTGNIKNGIVIFNVAGHVNVRDVSDATALVAEVKAGRTFYAVGGAIKTGTMATRTLSPDNETVLEGYYAATTLSTVDAHLAAANILSGVTIFGFTGPATVQDIADADAGVGDVRDTVTFYSVTGVIKTGTMPAVAITAVNDDYLAGYHAGNVGGLAAIDVNLAAANILSGVNIFGFVGVATVQDIADADAVLADVKNGKTFYSVTGGRKTGNLATVALAAGANAYPAGYHVGAASLTAVDGDLVTGSIKFGVTIFGVAGHTNVRDSSDADAVVANVLSPKTFYAGGGAKKTGTMPTVTLAAGSSAYPTGYHVGAASLANIDADFVVANIKSGVTLFGIVGTFTNTGSPPAASQVISGKECWANGAQITGTMPTVAIAAGSSAYPTGYHAGHGGGLPAIDADLATGNIKFGITIFNVAGHTNVRDSSDADAAVANVLSPKTFYAGGGAKKTGTMPTVAIVAANDNYPAGYHAGNVGGLDAIDAQLAPANIKKDVNIFGKVGTVEPALVYTELAGADGRSISVSDVWEDEDLSAIVPAGTKYVELNIYHYSGSDTTGNAGARKNGTALARYITTVVDENFALLGAVNMVVEVDANRVIEIRASQTTRFKFNVKGYWS